MSLLQFVNDTNFFSKANLEELQNFKYIIMVFGHILGLKINLKKCSLAGINVSENSIQDLALLLDCRVSVWPLTYLGLPLRENPRATSF